jgi:hypothetical protein
MNWAGISSADARMQVGLNWLGCSSGSRPQWLGPAEGQRVLGGWHKSTRLGVPLPRNPTLALALALIELFLEVQVAKRVMFLESFEARFLRFQYFDIVKKNIVILESHCLDD